jgi:ADP-ribosylglycohydrolase
MKRSNSLREIIAPGETWGRYFRKKGSENMRLITKTIETTGFINAQHQLLLNEQLPIASSDVRVIIMVTESADSAKAAAFKATPLNNEPDAIDALYGAFKNHLSSSDEFAQRKKEEIKLEEEKWQRK